MIMGTDSKATKSIAIFMLIILIFGWGTLPVLAINTFPRGGVHSGTESIPEGLEVGPSIEGLQALSSSLNEEEAVGETNNTQKDKDTTIKEVAVSAEDNEGEQTSEVPSLPPVTSDVYLLARLIYAESRGEPFTGKVAVGSVILNRMRNHRFPNTIAGVIFKKGEFCTVRDGQIYMTPDAEAIRAARYAMAGWDPTDGALYFYNPAKSTSKWIWSRTPVTTIGNHVFAI